MRDRKHDLRYCPKYYYNWLIEQTELDRNRCQYTYESIHQPLLVVDATKLNGVNQTLSKCLYFDPSSSR